MGAYRSKKLEHDDFSVPSQQIVGYDLKNILHTKLECHLSFYFD